MEMHQLRYVVALSQELNFQRAAKRVHITQPTLSQQIKKLEQELQTPLFERSAHGVKLTSAGETFLPHALAALDTLRRGAELVGDKTSEISGSIRVAAIPTMGPYLFPAVISSLKKSAPKLVLEIYEETTSVLLQHLKEGKIDLGILSLPIPDSAVVTRLLGEEELFLAVSRHHALASRKTVSLKSLRQEKLLILQEGHCFSDQSLEFCRRSREDAQVIFQGSSLTSVMRLAEAGDGITLVPKMAVLPERRTSLRFIRFSPPRPTRDIAAAWRVSAPLNRAHRLLMEIIEKAARKSS